MLEEHLEPFIAVLVARPNSNPVAVGAACAIQGGSRGAQRAAHNA
jgi:hypothetical protein